MIHTPKQQHWVLLGSAPASEEVWGLQEIEFPCGYHVPAGSFVAPGQPIACPAPGREVWAVAGFALEIGKGGKHILKDQAPEHIAGYRPWLALFHDVLLDELVERNHTVMVWDRGVSIFYGLWREASQALGARMDVETYQQLSAQPVNLLAEDTAHSGTLAQDYAHDAADVISFMSQFMTLSPGDIYVLGPLVAKRVDPDVDRLIMQVGDFSFEAALT